MRARVHVCVCLCAQQTSLNFFCHFLSDVRFDPDAQSFMSLRQIQRVLSIPGGKHKQKEVIFIRRNGFLALSFSLLVSFFRAFLKLCAFSVNMFLFFNDQFKKIQSHSK